LNLYEFDDKPLQIIFSTLSVTLLNNGVNGDFAKTPIIRGKWPFVSYDSHPGSATPFQGVYCHATYFFKLFLHGLSIYQSKIAVELRSVFDQDVSSSRGVCSCLSYENAKQMAEQSSHMNNLPVLDYSRVQMG
jgi:hypothetical protein